MSQFSLSKVSCPELQGRVDDFFAFGRAKRSFTPKLNFLTDPVNTDNLLQRNVYGGNGKTRTVEMIWTPRYLEDDVNTTIPDTCTSTNEAGHHSQTCEITLTTGVHVDEKWELKDLALICQRNPNYYEERLLAMFDGLRRRMETSIGTQIAAAAGGFADEDNDVSGDVKTVQTLQSGGVNTDLNAIEEIGWTKDLIGEPTLFTFGGGLISKYFKRLGDGCCITASGVDLGEFAASQDVVHFQDHRIGTALGATNGFLGLAPGAAHLAYANLYDGDNQYVDETRKLFTMVDPATGIPFDVSMVIECKSWEVNVSLPFVVCTAPTNYFATNDRLGGVNGIMEFLVSNP